jgi:hypothetical protein
LLESVTGMCAVPAVSRSVLGHDVTVLVGAYRGAAVGAVWRGGVRTSRRRHERLSSSRRRVTVSTKRPGSVYVRTTVMAYGESRPSGCPGRNAPVVRPAHRTGRRSRFARRRAGPGPLSIRCPGRSPQGTDGAAEQVSRGVGSSGPVAPAIRGRSRVRRRGACPSPFRLMKGCGPLTACRRPATYSIERVCHSRAPMGAPLPHSHHPPLHWGVSTQRRRVTGRGSRWPSSAEGSGVSWLQLARGL